MFKSSKLFKGSKDQNCSKVQEFKIVQRFTGSKLFKIQEFKIVRLLFMPVSPLPHCIALSLLLSIFSFLSLSPHPVILSSDFHPRFF